MFKQIIIWKRNRKIKQFLKNLKLDFSRLTLDFTPYGDVAYVYIKFQCVSTKATSDEIRMGEFAELRAKMNALMEFLSSDIKPRLEDKVTLEHGGRKYFYYVTATGEPFVLEAMLMKWFEIKKFANGDGKI